MSEKPKRKKGLKADYKGATPGQLREDAKKTGRPTKYSMSEILNDATPEQVAEALLRPTREAKPDQGKK